MARLVRLMVERWIQSSWVIFSFLFFSNCFGI